MEPWLQACGGALIVVILCLTLGKQGKDLGLLLTMAGCCLVLLPAVRYLEPVMDFVRQLEDLGNLDGDLVGILLKAAGIGFLTEICNLVCSDGGNAALGKALQLLGSGVILWLSIPLFQALLDLLQKILGGV